MKKKSKTPQNLELQGKQMIYILNGEKKESKIKHNKSVVSFLLYYILKGQHWGHIGKRKKQKCQFKLKMQINLYQISRTYQERRDAMNTKACVLKSAREKQYKNV